MDEGKEIDPNSIAERRLENATTIYWVIRGLSALITNPSDELLGEVRGQLVGLEQAMKNYLKLDHEHRSIHGIRQLEEAAPRSIERL